MQVLVTLRAPDWLASSIAEHHKNHSDQFFRPSRLEPHITLLPPQTISPNQLAAWQTAASKTAQLATPGPATVSKVEFINPSSLVLMLRSEVAHSVHARLKADPIAAGIPDRPFRPHITVGRATRTLTQAAQRRLRHSWSDMIDNRPLTLGALRLYIRNHESESYRIDSDYQLLGTDYR